MLNNFCKALKKVKHAGFVSRINLAMNSNEIKTIGRHCLDDMLQLVNLNLSFKDVPGGMSHFLPKLTYKTLISQQEGRLPLELAQYYLIILYCQKSLSCYMYTCTSHSDT